MPSEIAGASPAQQIVRKELHGSPFRGHLQLRTPMMSIRATSAKLAPILPFPRRDCMARLPTLSRFGDLSSFVHEEVIYNKSPPMSVVQYGRMIKDLVKNFSDFRFAAELLVVEPAGLTPDGSGLVSARLRLSYYSPPQQSQGHREVFHEHVFYEFRRGKISEVWAIVQWPKK
ncbi:hypothetical protein LTR72_005142 [Exophiala xenobiotica]|nr:hypothetical protein LTR72_005142 [Exophiala xenobiotica]KAK5289157.1 hypothetical protein LTR14_007408 [Exophiala xenobiotica]KAK5500051.1 hypothetical protein LTR55_000874 [Exophiala xenobiotica]